MPRIKLAFVVVCALSVAACTATTRVHVTKENLSTTTRSIVGTSLIGAKGATQKDQDAIDDTAAGICAAGVWTQAECKAHGKR